MNVYSSLFHSPIFKVLPIMSYYAVAKGRSPGVYNTWNDCKSQIHKFSGAVFKKFPTLLEAESFINERKNSSPALSRINRNYSKLRAEPYCISSQSKIKKEIAISELDYFEEEFSPPNEDISIPTSTEIFQRDSEGRVDIYTDGACSLNGCKNAKAGLGVFFGDNHPANVSKPVRGRVTNNNAEIQAVIEAAKISQKYDLKKIRINTDSEFLINCKTKWMKKWKITGWKTANKQPVINRKELEEMERVLAPLDVEFNHVRGHVGIHGNEMADKLAREGAEMS